jgi:hypothetical protein
MVNLLQRLCPHGWWSYNTYRRRRWCRVCGLQQRSVEDVPTYYDPLGWYGGVTFPRKWIDA